MTWASQINEYSLVASGTRPAHGARAYKGCLYWSAVHLAIIFRHIIYLLTKHRLVVPVHGNNGIVRPDMIVLCLLVLKCFRFIPDFSGVNDHKTYWDTYVCP